MYRSQFVCLFMKSHIWKYSYLLFHVLSESTWLRFLVKMELFFLFTGNESNKIDKFRTNDSNNWIVPFIFLLKSQNKSENLLHFGIFISHLEMNCFFLTINLCWWLYRFVFFYHAWCSWAHAMEWILKIWNFFLSILYIDDLVFFLSFFTNCVSDQWGHWIKVVEAAKAAVSDLSYFE